MHIQEISPYEILDRITDAFFALDKEWKFTYVNKEATRLLLRKKEQFIGNCLWDEFPETIDLQLYHQFHKAVNEQVAVNFEHYSFPLKSWFEVRAYPSPNGLSVYFQDITDKKQFSSHREQHYKSLFENNPDAVYSLDLDGNYLSVNRATEQLLGYSAEEFLQMSYIPLIASEEIEKTMEYFSKATSGSTQHYETIALHKNGQAIAVKVTNMPIIVHNEIVGVYGIAKDISKEKRTEKMLLESEKLSAVGQLAASIAHEIRNPLTSIKGFLQLYKKSMKQINSEYLNIMSDELSRIEMITGELLVLAKPQAHHFHNERVEKILDDVVTLLSSQALMNNVEVKVHLEDLPQIKCIASQLKQVFINLIKNAIEAMPDGGEITIMAKKHTSTTIFIQFADQGSGISEELLAKIGTPFYTTKEKGTGLGMMTTLKIIHTHGGTMNISSTIGKGTIIDIYLPISI
ncbi:MULTISPECIES: PAS domain S-box protein [Metabacillus]|uniref:histidine kinase n=1 Tax=Metabacillus litoralis TaxID=152268 RepID=A0A179T276_9BACI|nr:MULTISPECIES: PAS domain S-box protein [Metabacillus]OAS87490.1 PAS domain-containing sensor histidine kinase [Metabacillus litoralis]